MSYFLNVYSSMSKSTWLKADNIDYRKSERINQKYNIPLILSQLVCKQNIDEENIATYLDPKLKDLLPNPSTFLDMDKAIKRFIDGIKKKEKILIFGDYDVDGVVSSVLIKEWAESLNINIDIYFPDRIKEGYGPNSTAFENLSKDFDLIICVDCGTNSINPIKIAKKNNTDVIILDHHPNNSSLPEAHSIVNPNRTDECNDYPYLCGAGITFVFLVGVNREIRGKEFQEPDLIKSLDLVALATVADIVPLKGLNRAFVFQGIKVLKKRNRFGLTELLDLNNQYNEITGSTLGFNIGPKINACGRISDAKIAMKLLTSKNKREAKELALIVESINEKRKKIEEDVLNSINSKIIFKEKNNFIWAANKNFHQGVIGIISGKLKDKYNRPSLIISINDDGVCVGSGRSIVGINLYEKIKILISEKLIISGGGHQMAVGFKIYEKNIQKTMNRLESLVSSEILTQHHKKKFKIDNLLSINSVSPYLVKQINLAGPFGNSNPEPIYAFANCKILFLKKIKNKHIKLTIQDNSDHKLEAFYFNSIDTFMGQELLKDTFQKYHFIGSLEINNWKGNSKPILLIKDISKIS